MRINFPKYRAVMTAIGVFVSFSFSVGSMAVSPSREEFDQASAWVKANFSTSSPAIKLPPFSFVYGGKRSSELLKG